MAKFTRTVYASAPAQFLAKEIAAQAAIAGNEDLGLAYDTLHQRAGKGRKRVRITITVEPAPSAPKRKRGPTKPRPVQLSLDVAPPAGTVVPVTGDACMTRFMSGLEQVARSVDPSTLRTPELPR